MKKRISKKKIIEALRTEPLVGGRWMALNHDYAGQESVGEAKSSCTVCAVGAVLRRIVPQRMTVYDFNDFCLDAVKGVSSIYDESIKRALSEKNYLGALSAYFEEMAERSSDFKITNRQRPALIRFVEKHFPQYITVEIPDEAT